jgi:hypothetical protein
MSVYAGIDVHCNRSQVGVIDAGGEVLANRNLPNEVEAILCVLGGPAVWHSRGIRGRVRLGWQSGGVG